MILTMFWENPAVVGLILAIPATALGYLGYRRSLPVDKAVKQVGEMAGHIGLITALQADNLVLRGRVERLEARLDVAEAAEQRLVAAEREIVVLHAENKAADATIAALRVENQKLTKRISELEKANGP